MSNEPSNFWMVYGLHQGAPTARHHTKASAVSEASRLARLHPGIKFYVLETITLIVKRDVDVIELGETAFNDGIPF